MQIRTSFARCRSSLRAARLFPSPRQRGGSLIFPLPAVARRMSIRGVARTRAKTGRPLIVPLHHENPRPPRPRTPACPGLRGCARARKEMSGVEFHPNAAQGSIAGRSDSIEKA